MEIQSVWQSNFRVSGFQRIVISLQHFYTMKYWNHIKKINCRRV